MPLRFSQLQVGQRFHYEGVGYVKSSPLVAHSETDGQARVIPRSALVQPEGEPAPAAAPAPRSEIPAAEVQQAWEAFQHRINAALATLAADAGGDAVAALQQEWAAARARFERALGLSP